MLLLADRGFVGFDLWRAAAATGAELVWRTKTNAVLPVDRQLGDGSYLSRIYAARDQPALLAAELSPRRQSSCAVCSIYLLPLE